MQIYDPAASINYFGLGFPGAASRQFVLSNPNRITFSPIFNSYTPLLFKTDFQTSFITKKPITQIEYIIFPSIKTEQYLDLIHIRNINPNINVGACLRKLKSNGYFLNQGSNLSNLLAFVDLKSPNQRYSLYANFVYNGLVSIENAGVQSSEVDYSSTSLSLQSLPVNIENAKTRVTLYEGEISQSFRFGTTEFLFVDSSTTRHVFHPKSQINASLNYSSHATAFLYSNPLSGYFEQVLKDSNYTNDKYLFNSFKSEISYSSSYDSLVKKQKVPNYKIGLFNERSLVDTKESGLNFSNTAAFLALHSNTNSLIRYSAEGNYFIEGYNLDNYNASFMMGKRFLDSTDRQFNADILVESVYSRPDYVFQNFFSNHFKWKNNFEKTKTNSLSFRITSKKNSFFSVKLMQFEKLVFLDSLAVPSQLQANVNYVSANFGKLFKLGHFYLNTNFVYQKVVKGRDVFGLPELFTRNSIYWANSIFKKAMDLQIGFDVVYASSFYGLAYQPSLNEFYFQNKRKQGNYPAIDLFVNFKIRQVRCFFKVDHLNYGLNSGKYEYVPGYLLPGRTFRFGLSWLFIN
jgi:hypothetical protein